MFASCDDRGSTPSGGSDLTVTIGLPARTDYPASASGFSVAMPSKDGALIYASSVTYTAATEKEAASLVAAGFSVPKEGLAPAAIVSFESTAFGLVATEPVAVSGVLSLIGTIETADAFKTVPVITVTVEPSEAGAFPMPTAASDYALTFKSDGSSVAFTPNSDQVKITQGKDAVTTEPQADAVKAQAVITVPQSFALGNLSSGEYSVTMAGWSSDGNDYTAAAGSLEYALGKELTVSMAASQIEYGSITVQLPEKFTSKAVSGTEGISIASVGAISYAISQSGNQVASGTLTLGAPADSLISASPIKIAASETAYDVAVSFAYDNIPFAGTTQVSSVAAGGTTTNAQIQATDIDAQIADLSVSFAESPVPAEWPTLASAYSISYAVLDSDGKPGAAVPVTVTSDMASSMSEGFKIAGVPSGRKYQVSVSFTDITGKWTGTGDLADEAASVDASSPDNAVTVTLTAPKGYVEPEPEESTKGTVTINTVEGITGVSGGSAEYAVTWKDNASGSGSGSYSGSGSMTLSDVPTSDESVTVTVVVTGATSGNGTYTSTVSSISFEEDSATVESATFVQAKASVTVTCSGLDDIAGDAPVVTWGTQDGGPYSNSGTYTSETSISLTDVPVGTTTVYIQVADGGSSSSSKTFKGTATIAWSGLEETVSQAVAFSEAD